MAEGYYDSLGRNLVLYNELNKLLTEFDRQSIQAILLKGIYLAKFIYSDIALRPMSDVDILVQRDDLNSALGVLKSLGYETKNDLITEDDLFYYNHAPDQIKEDLIKLELHWKLSVFDCGLTIDESTLWEHVQTIRLSGVEAMGLSLEELVLHICTHASYSHIFFQQVRSVVDLAEILSKKSSQINWRILLEEAHNWRVERGLFVMLYISHQYLGAPIPDRVLMQLTPVDFTPAMIEDVFHLFLFRVSQVNTNSARLANSASWKDRAKTLLRLVFPPRREVGHYFSAPANSWRIFFYYPKFYRDRINRQWQTVVNLFNRNEDTARYLKSLNNVDSWLFFPKKNG